MHSKYDNWQPMATAPIDGTEITVLYVHLCSENCYGKKQGLCSDKCSGCFLPPMEHAASYHPSAGLHMCEFRTPVLWKPKNTSNADAAAEVPKEGVRQVDVFTFFTEELAGIVGPKTRIVTQSAKLCFTIPLDSWLWQRTRELLELTAACEMRYSATEAKRSSVKPMGMETGPQPKPTRAKWNSRISNPQSSLR